MSSVKYPEVLPVSVRLGLIAFLSTTSIVFGVGHPASATICPKGLPVSHGLASFTPRLASVAVAVGQPASITKSFRLLPCRVSPIARFACPPPVLSLA